MTIANPIYDIVFKYLMEDLDIAKGLLSTILDVEITELSMQPQETISETGLEHKPIRVYRIDFAAVVKQQDGQIKKVLIENQTLKSSDEHSLNYETSDDDPLLQKMLNRLTRAIASEEMRRKMNVEDEIESEFADFQDTIEQKEEEIKQNKLAIEQNKQVIEQNKQAIEEKEQLIEQKDQEIEENRRLIEELQQKLNNINK